MELVEDFSDICSLPNIARCLPESLHQHRDRAVLQLVQRVFSPCTLARGGGGLCEGAGENLEGARGDLEAGGDLEGATQAVDWVEDISRGRDGMEDP